MLEQAIELEGRLPDGGPDLVIRLAALLHDIGKPKTRRFQAGGTVTFHHHDVVGAKLARKRLRALRFTNATVDAGGQARSSCTCGSTATAPASGPTQPCAATCATPATSSSACTS